MSDEVKWCNWTFWEVIKRSNKYGISRDCDSTPLVDQAGYGKYDYDENVTVILSRSDSRNWLAYKSALLPHGTGEPPSNSSKCPSCGKYVNGVNPYDDGQTWRK